MLSLNNCYPTFLFRMTWRFTVQPRVSHHDIHCQLEDESWECNCEIIFVPISLTLPLFLAQVLLAIVQRLTSHLILSAVSCMDSAFSQCLSSLERLTSWDDRALLNQDFFQDKFTNWKLLLDTTSPTRSARECILKGLKDDLYQELLTKGIVVHTSPRKWFLSVF
jgi:hypothetical protein